MRARTHAYMHTRDRTYFPKVNRRLKYMQPAERSCRPPFLAQVGANKHVIRKAIIKLNYK